MEKSNLSEDYDYIVKETRKLIEVLKPHMVRVNESDERTYLEATSRL